MSLIVLTDAHLLPPSDATPLTLTPLSSIVKIIKISSVTPWSEALDLLDEGWSFHHDIMPVLIPGIQSSLQGPLQHHAATVTTYQTLFLTFGICRRSPETIITSSARHTEIILIS